MYRKNFPGRKRNKQEQANERQVKRNALTDTQQLQLLDRRLGINQGAQKERVRLTKRIEKSTIKESC